MSLQKYVVFIGNERFWTHFMGSLTTYGELQPGDAFALAEQKAFVRGESEAKILSMVDGKGRPFKASLDAAVQVNRVTGAVDGPVEYLAQMPTPDTPVIKFAGYFHVGVTIKKALGLQHEPEPTYVRRFINMVSNVLPQRYVPSNYRGKGAGERTETEDDKGLSFTSTADAINREIKGVA